VTGWGLVTTPLERHGKVTGIPTVAYLGSRAVYLGTEPGVMYRVLTAPHPSKPFESRLIQIRGTSVPDLLAEDPTLYYGLFSAAENSIAEFSLNYELPSIPIPGE
jgi:hypothetical protein